MEDKEILHHREHRAHGEKQKEISVCSVLNINYITSKCRHSFRKDAEPQGKASNLSDLAPLR